MSTAMIRLLLVDDEEEFLLSSSRALARRGFDVDVAPNGITALDKIENNEYDIVALDVKMPDIEGTDVFLQIRKIRPSLPVILITGHGSLEEAFVTGKAGIADYLSKPVDIEEFAEHLRAALRRAEEADSASSEIQEPATGSSEAIRVMLVDDEIEFLQTMKKILERRNMSIMTAADGESALALLREASVDIIVLDLKMPGMGGEEVLRRVKKEYPGIEVIILTGHPTVDSALKVIKLGANEYIKKPPKIEELVSTIQGLYTSRQNIIQERQRQLIDEILRRYPE